eukprot:2983337-Lingulodinium_polyedra.AAC.2
MVPQQIHACFVVEEKRFEQCAEMCLLAQDVDQDEVRLSQLVPDTQVCDAQAGHGRPGETRGELERPVKCCFSGCGSRQIETE